MSFNHVHDSLQMRGSFRDFGGGGGAQPVSTTSTTTQALSPEQQQLLQLVIPEAEKFVKNPPQLFPGSSIAGFDPLQLAGQQMTLNAAGSLLPQQLGRAENVSQFLAGPVLFPESNPALAAATEAAIRPLTQQFQNVTLPGIRHEAITAGGYGGTRQGIAEGIAGRGLAQKSGDIASTMASQAYGQGLDAMLKGLQFTPQLAQTSLVPGAATEAVGAQKQALTQAQLNEQVTKFVQEQILPFMAAQEVAALAFGIPGGSTTTTGTGTQYVPQTSPLQYLMGGLSLAGLFI